MRSRLRQLHNLLTTGNARTYPDVVFIKPPVEPTPVEAKVAELFSGPVSTLEVPKDSQADWDTQGLDSMVYLDGVKCGRSSSSTFPSVALTEAIQGLNADQRRGLAMHLGLEDIVKEFTDEIGAKFNEVGIRSVIVGVKEDAYKGLLPVSLVTKVDPKPRLSGYAENDPTERAVVIMPRTTEKFAEAHETARDLWNESRSKVTKVPLRAE